MARLLGLILLLPIVEFIVFVLVAASIGLGKAVLLQVAISLIGVAMIGSLVTEAKSRAKGGGGLISLALDKSSSLRGVAGLLFLVPGFVTDVLGVMALVPEVRARLRRLIGGPLAAPAPEVRTRTTAATRPAPGEIVDLDAREWRETAPKTRTRA